MHFKEDVLSQFKNMRSCERIDLICSLMDLCLPFELRFLGTCLEFLGKRDFYELREDERLANNVNHISQLRSLTDENTRRKLVLYVSLLKSCNSDCANCINDTLAALCINDVNLCCRSDGESAAKIIDEFLLLYTIALKHPAFSIHQKSEFASLLALLQEEDRKLTPNPHSSKDLICKSSENSSSDYHPDTQSQLQSSPSGAVEDSDSSSHISAKSQASPLTCHVYAGSSYAADALSPTLSQASTASLGTAPVPDSTTTSPPNEPKSLVSIVGGECSHNPLPMALPVAPVMGPGMMVPLASSASHCILQSPSLPSPGEMGMQKGHHAVLIGVPGDPVMPVPFPPSWAMMMTMPGPEAPSPSLAPSVPSPPLVPEAVPAPTSGAISTSSLVCTPSAAPCASFTPAISNSSLLISSSSSISPPLSASMENTTTAGISVPQHHSQPSSPSTSRDPTPTRKGQMSGHGKPVHQQPHSIHQHVQQVPQMLSAATPSLVHTYSVGQSPQCTNQSSVPHAQPAIAHPHVFQQQSSPPPQAWDTSGDSIKDVIGREMPKYSSLQDYSPDELLHMSEEQLKDIGLPLSAIQQLRSIMGKLHVTNGITCPNRPESYFQNECVESRRRCLPIDKQIAMGIPVPGPGVGQPSYGFMVPVPHAGVPVSNSNNGGNCIKGNHRQHHHQIVHQVRALQLEDDSRRPCSNSSSTSDCSSGSHSPPETPHSLQWDRGGDLGESWNCDRSREDRSQDERVRDDRLHEPERNSEERGRGPSHQPFGLPRNLHNSRPRGLSKAPPGIPSVPRGRGHHLMDKSRRDGSSGGPMNGVTPNDVNSFPMSAGASVPYTSFLPPGAFPVPAFHRFPGNYLPTTYAYPHNGELWSQFAQPAHQNPQFMAPIVAFSPAHPPPKLSCYNCGGQGHQGSDCKESTFEEITQQGQYHLDYKPFKEPGDCRESDK